MLTFGGQELSIGRWGSLPNGLVERLIGAARHECMDHILVFTEEHLRRILSEYARYYNEVRPHLSLGKDAPWTRLIEWFGDIIAQPILGGLHHRMHESEFSEAAGYLTHQNGEVFDTH
jgi:hypothetical protein